MDQSKRYADLGLNEEQLIAGGKHILAAYRMKPKAGTTYLAAAAHFAAESSTGTNVEVSTTDDFTKGLDALVYHIDEASEDLRIAYPIDLFDRNIIDGRFMMVSFLTLTIGNNPVSYTHLDVYKRQMSLLPFSMRANALHPAPPRSAPDDHRRSSAP